MKSKTLSIVYGKKDVKKIKREFAKKIRLVMRKDKKHYGIIQMHEKNPGTIDLIIEPIERKNSISFLTVAQRISDLPIIFLEKEILVKKMFGRRCFIKNMDCVFMDSGEVLIAMTVERKS